MRSLNGEISWQWRWRRQWCPVASSSFPPWSSFASASSSALNFSISIAYWCSDCLIPAGQHLPEKPISLYRRSDTGGNCKRHGLTPFWEMGKSQLKRQAAVLLLFLSGLHRCFYLSNLPRDNSNKPVALFLAIAAVKAHLLSTLLNDPFANEISPQMGSIITSKLCPSSISTY